MTFVLVPPGMFSMGSTVEEIATVVRDAESATSPDSNRGLAASEGPQHSVVISRPTTWPGTT